MELLLAAPRGFCAGVSRAVEIVERALELYGAPVYVKHEIIHNRQVVERLRERGAVFVEDLSEVPEGATLIFSAHGVPPSDRELAEARGLRVVDATCPLVTKVHLEAVRYARQGYYIVYIGHRNHPEPIGTLGEIRPDQGALIETPADAEALTVPDAERVMVLTQTTLSVDDTRDVLERLRRRFPKMATPPTDDICYATTNRQMAVKELAKSCDLVLVIGSQTSSNSKRLVEVARAAGATSYLIDSAVAIDPAWLEGVKAVGLSSGASAPEDLVQEAVRRLEALGAPLVREVRTVDEDMFFPLPKEVRVPTT
ncbi:MAG: 4-hydroxy-3-methylbut-2-enyl diphosphate reductase [Chloroflexi bacterium]|nr:4-hydroxy-3-methylbut-2-enyl diphosphate reductase [Chloroflexota bacterium]